MNRKRQSLLASIFGVLVCSYAAQAQTAPPTILQIDISNVVEYFEDTTDLSKLATVPGVTTPVPAANFRKFVQIGDIVAVNGQPAKGTFTFNARSVILRTAPNPGEAIADTTRNTLHDVAFEILSGDGSPIGTIMAMGLGVGSPTPGAPLAITQGNNAIAGGTGAFLGARGMMGQAMTAQTIAVRQASMTEDPSNRIANGGGRIRFVAELIPMTRPDIPATPIGPAVFHADFSPVTAAKPAKAGEILIVKATGLGPTVPGVDPGQPFPSDVLQPVNSPVGVSVNGQPAEVVNAIGWPGQVDTFRVDFRMPNGGATGTAAIQLTAAWITGAAVGIPVQ
jgi:hypothetical protein